MGLTPESLEAASFVLQVLQVVLVPIIVWIVKRINCIHKTVTKLNGYNSVLSQRIDGMPGVESYLNLNLSIEKLSGKIDTLNERQAGNEKLLTTIDAKVDRHADYLMNNK